MLKINLSFLFLAIWVITQIKSEAPWKNLIDGFSKDNSRYWLISCTLGGCSFAFSSCMNCYGERGCKSCIALSKPECAVCADDIFNKEDLETINGNQYLICDSGDPIQSKVCHLYCRGQFAESGNCVRENNLPICKCSSETGSSTTDSSVTTQTTQSTTISQSTAAPNVSTIHFNGIVKLNISIGSYQRIWPLQNGDLVRGSYGNLIEIWDLQKGIVKTNLTSVYSNPHVFGILSNGDMIAGYRNNKALLIWDLKRKTDNQFKRIIQTNENLFCLTVLKNDDLAIGQNDYPFDIIIRNSQDGLVKNKLVGHKSTVYQIIELPNGNLVSCSFDKTVKVWNILNGAMIKSISHKSAVFSIVILQNGHLVSGLSDGIINIWNLKTNNTIGNFNEHSSAICRNTCLYAFDNGDLLSASWDQSIKVWNPSDGTEKCASQLHKSSVRQIAVLPSGNFISSSDYELIVWK